MTGEGFKRENNRSLDQKREVSFETNYLKTNPYSVMINMGDTKVLCAATTGNWTPPHIRNTDRGWISAQYSMLPNSSGDRVNRERNTVKGRTKEIERLIGRAFRSVCDLRAIPFESIIVDCDVIQADGGTRTASVTGGFIALYMLVKDLQRTNKISRSPINDFLAAVSVGVVHGKPMLDLDSSEDKAAQVDMNLVMTDMGRISEIQATGEEATFKMDDFNRMIELGKKGIKELIKEQKTALGII